MAEHAPYVWRVLRGLGVPDGDLPDISQETFLIVHRQLHTFEGRSSMRTWICGIALRAASDYRRKAYRRRERAHDVVPERGAPPGQHSRLERDEAWRLLDRVLSGLSEEQRRAFVLYELEQMPMDEVAAVMGCPRSTGYSRLHAARAEVRRALAEQEGNDAP